MAGRYPTPAETGVVRRPEQLSLGLADAPEHPLDFRVRESARARRMSINVTPHRGIEVVVPLRTTPGRVRRFVEEHRGWIEKTRETFLGEEGAAMDISLPSRIEFPAFEQAWEVRYERREQDAIRLREEPGLLFLRGPVGDDGDCRARLCRWLAFKGHGYLGPALAELAHRHGFQFSRLQVRGQRTRWGSCSSRGTISLNYALLFLPSGLVRYVMLHELCHTRYMSHGPRFWSLLERLEPEGRELDRELDEAWRDIPGWVTA